MKIIYGLLILSFIIIVHELGHFFAALLCKVKVEAFSVGMGPVLLHKTVKGIDWRISLLPIGGYCAMKGESEFSSETDSALQKKSADSLYGASPFKRIAIAAAGPLANLLFTFLCFLVISMTGYFYYSASSKITLVNEIYPELPSAAGNAGIKTGDIITKINGEKIEDFNALFSFVSVHPDEYLKIEVLRGEELLDFTVKSELDKSTGAGKIGVASSPDSVQKKEASAYSFFPAAVQAAKETKSIFAASMKGIAGLFKGVKLTEAVSGPAAITSMLGDTIQSSFKTDFRTGLAGILNFVALINISLFIMNLLPVPILDGGLILISLIEGIFRISISPKSRIIIQYIGAAFIAFFFIIAVVGDFNFFMRIFNEK